MVTISNPPYNMKWDIPVLGNLDERFTMYEIPPKSNANYAFVLSALKESDKCIFILPNGVLKPSTKEEKQIVKALVQNNFIKAVIMLPDNMFEKTSIATCILYLDKNKETTDIEMIDARKKCVVEEREQRGQFGGKQHTNRVYKKQYNTFTDENINQILDAIDNKKTEIEFCKNVKIDEVINNNYNLAPSIYIEIDLNDKVKRRSYDEIIEDLNRIIKEKNSCKLTINETIARNMGFDLELYKESQTDEMNEFIKMLTDKKITKEDYFTTTKKKNDLKFENNSKDNLSSILIMILNSWKQHIYYLNTEENRYLAELRDKAIEDLMIGKIKV